MPTPDSPDDFSPPTTAYPRCAVQCALLAEANHRAANQFALLTSYIHLSLEDYRRRPGEVRNLELAFASIEVTARALASLNRRLIERPASSQLVDVSLMLHEICATFGGSVNPRHTVVDAVVGPYQVTPNVNMAVGQIVTEAVMNALKYAYPEDQAGEITVRTTPVETGELLIEVADRGVEPLPPSLLSTFADSFGVRLMCGLARQEHIGLNFEAASPGLSVQLVLPPAEIDRGPSR